MSRKVLQAAKCSQMSSPKTGTGSGGDRCTEAVGAMIDATYKIGAWAKDGQHTVEQIMYQFTEMLNQGRDTSAPENASWIGQWTNANSSGTVTIGDIVNPSFQQIIDCIDRNHVAIGGFNDYVSLRLANGQNPYSWTDPHGLGHVLLIVGYDTSKQVVVVHDPLRANPSGQPADYSWSGFQAAQFHDLSEVHGAPLPLVEGSMLPNGWTDDGAALHNPVNSFVVAEPFRTFVLAQNWNSQNVPLEDQKALLQVELSNPTLGGGKRQWFRMGVLEWTTARGVFVGWCGQEFLHVEALYDALLATPPAPPVPPPAPAEPSAWDKIGAELTALIKAS